MTNFNKQEVKRPIARYHGGKWMLAPWIISHFPKHEIYVEPYGGAASVLLRKKRSKAEVYNDMSSEMVNLFYVVRDHGYYFAMLLHNTPFSRDEFNRAREKCMGPIERARRTVIRSFMGFGSNSITTCNSGFRANSNRSGSTPARDFMNLPESIKMICERMRGVIIENRPALEVCANHDGENTLHYLDPPYMKETRGPGNDYEFEMTDEQHLEMIQKAKSLKGFVIISGYDNDLYNENLKAWHKVRRAALADGAKKRIECLWINEKATANQPNKTLF